MKTIIGAFHFLLCLALALKDPQTCSISFEIGGYGPFPSENESKILLGTQCSDIELDKRKELMPKVKVNVIYYGKATIPTERKGRVDHFLNGIDSSGWFETTNAYFEKNVKGKVIAGKWTAIKYDDQFEANLANAANSNSKLTLKVAFKPMIQFVENLIASKKLPKPEPIDSYLILIDESKYDMMKMNGFTSLYCAYHYYANYSTDGRTARIPFMVIPLSLERCNAYHFLGRLPRPIKASSSPSKDLALDGRFNDIAHELTELMTDPFISGWYDKDDGKENADKCAWRFGDVCVQNMNGKTPTNSTLTENYFYNVVFKDGTKHLVQLNYDRHLKKCVNPPTNRVGAPVLNKVGCFTQSSSSCY